MQSLVNSPRNQNNLPQGHTHRTGTILPLQKHSQSRWRGHHRYERLFVPSGRRTKDSIFRVGIPLAITQTFVS